MRQLTRQRGLTRTVPTIFLVVASLLPAAAAHAQSVGSRPFDQGRMRFGLVAGGGTTGGDTYFVAGGSGSYFVFPGLALGVEITHRFFQNNVTKVSPGITYVLDFGDAVSPYAGVFYRRWFAYGSGDLNTAGVRGGINYLLGRRAFLSFGVGYETVLDACTGSCDFTYPELSLSFSL